MRLVVELLFAVAAAFPRRAVFPAGCVFGGVFKLIGYRKKVIRDNLQRAFPEHSSKELRRLRSRVYRHFGLLAVEMLRLPRQSPEQLLANSVFEGLDNLYETLRQGRGVLVLSGHLGNWETGLATAAAHGFKVAAVTRRIKGGLGQYIADRMRQSHGVTAINRRTALRPILSFLKKHAHDGGVGFVLDQNAKRDDGVFVDFFGTPACTMAGLAVMAKRYRTPVVPLVFFRDSEGRHHLRFLPEVKWEEVQEKGEPHKKPSSIEHNTQRYTKILEQAIREHPEQWIWMHKRWRTSPD